MRRWNNKIPWCISSKIYINQIGEEYFNIIKIQQEFTDPV